MPAHFINRARDIAYLAHKADKDKAGEPYKHHLHAVATGVRLLGGSDEAVAAAYLHDIIEDHPALYSAVQLINIDHIPADVVDIVLAVTKHMGQPQEEYLEQVISGGIDAMHVKLADLLNNTRHDRLAVLPEYTRNRLLKKYRPAIARLMLELGLIVEDSAVPLNVKPVGTATMTSFLGKEIDLMARIDQDPEERETELLRVNVFLDCPECGCTFDHTFPPQEGVYENEDLIAPPEDDVTCPDCGHEWHAEAEVWFSHDDA